jgi:hypothetical protein
MIPSPARPVALLTSVLLLLVGCTASDPVADDDEGRPTQRPPSKTTAPPPAPPPAPPKVGECRKLGYEDIARFSNQEKPRSCKRRHTSYTFAVTRLPRSVAFDGVTIDNDAVQRTAAQSCRRLFAGFVGGTSAARTLARLTVTYFVPTQRGFDLGARWVRCDVTGLHDENRLATLPRNLEGFLDNEGALDEFGVCSRGEPGSSGFRLVMCRAEHDYRAIRALRLGGADDPYPSRTTALDDGRAACEEIISDHLDRSGGYTFGWTYPSAEDWSAGQRFGYCWLQTTS